MIEASCHVIRVKVMCKVIGAPCHVGSVEVSYKMIGVPLSLGRDVKFPG